MPRPGALLSLAELDREVHDWVVAHRVDALDGLFVALSWVGYAGAVWILIALGTALLRRRLEFVVVTAVAVWSADLLALGIKAAVGRDRPFVVVPEPEPLVLGVAGDSFPSGHAATAAAGATVVARHRPDLLPYAVVLAVGIAFSRVYVGVHYPLDVLAGALLGTATALLTLAAARRRSARPPTRG